ncbi:MULTISPECIES: pyruvate dehydrogenase complex dihydrolipoamide acetyltransferase [Bartonella]|uniref:pyruvate dehydrogenase complex dihydrolipoamide acetyltransferase n=1 Tax=Bartonella TaxID=773 RepID=UPI0018DB67F8|nr:MULTISPECIES: pyruvate dehydrogenase complex dihydrolipoamide acetyltransferase [Bartonella]MBH9975223.1 pyruvate dehydrogenase complex dihydrolipoamide acetyltransferase [Bartonella choladocola]MBI0014829.1 pyruvate dehydrogenase complex dihydrolipoamide acetyltransferase [Bartonella sp. B10834G3]
MAIKITMPALSPTMEEGTLSKWDIKVGDKVSPGDTVAEIETDKATMEVDAADEGTLAKIVVPAGTQGVKVNALIGILAEDGESAEDAIKAIEDEEKKQASSSPAAAQPASPAAAPQKADASAPVAAATSPNPTPATAVPPASKAPVTDKGNRIFASPLARRLAKQNGLQLELISGTGPHGRIIKRDIDAALANGTGKAAPATAQAVETPASAGSSSSDEQVLKLFNTDEYEIVPHDGMRKTIAKRLVESKHTVPHFYVTIDCELDALLKLRAELNAAAPMVKTSAGEKPAYKLSVNDMVIKATALALKAVPDANVSWLDSGMMRHKFVDVGVAVSIPNGLITPIIKHAEEKSLSTISNAMKDLAKRARERKLKPEEYQGGTTAVSNMGMYGVKDFCAIINPPHATIFAIGAGEQRAVVKNGALAIATVMSVTLSTDHRAVDGALAAELAQAFKKFIENPMSMLV